MDSTDILQLVIREEAADDAATIDQVNLSAFAGHPYSRQTEHLIVRALRAAGGLSLSLVATVEGQVVGHLAFSPVQMGGVELGWWGLGPLSVTPAHQRAGVGSALMRSGLRRLGELGVPGCVVLGDPRFYGRFGFTPLPGLVYPGVPGDHFSARVLRGAAPRGEVRYHAAFGVQA